MHRIAHGWNSRKIEFLLNLRIANIQENQDLGLDKAADTYYIMVKPTMFGGRCDEIAIAEQATVVVCFCIRTAPDPETV